MIPTRWTILGNLRWNDSNPDKQEMIEPALPEAAKLRLDKLTREDLDDIARFVTFAVEKRPKAERGKVRHG